MVKQEVSSGLNQSFTSLHISQLDWVIFDADETLFDFDATRRLNQLFAGYGVHFGQQEYAEYQRLNKPLWDAYQAGNISAAELQTSRFALWAQKLNVTAEELNNGFLQVMGQICQPLPAVQEMLEALSGRVKLAIITNGFTAMQNIRLQRTGLKDYFELLVISEQVGAAKPSKAIFEHALQKMGQPDPKRVLMVGDNPDSDILGGHRAGMQTCWYNPKAQAKPAHITPHLEVSCHRQLFLCLGLSAS